MKIIKVNLERSPYDIVIGSGILKQAARHIAKLGIGHDAYIITNSVIKKHYGNSLFSAFEKSGLSIKCKLIPDSERSKSMRMALCILNDIASYDKQRKVFIIAFGGGVAGDLSGFIASIYKRGIPYIQIPTTLLGQVDSSIGGKTGVDLAKGKNLVGTFYQPRIVLSDVSLLASLSRKQLSSGLAEVIKYAIIKDQEMFSFLEKSPRGIFSLKDPVLEFIVSRCAQIKADIVKEDEKEDKGIRTILNFGHTIGHAIESAASYQGYSHGEAVALGMLAACGISQKIGLLKGAVVNRIENLIAALNLPIYIQNLSAAKIIQAHYHDKKFSGNKNRFVLIKDIAKAAVVNNIPLKIIKESIESRIR